MQIFSAGCNFFFIYKSNFRDAVKKLNFSFDSLIIDKKFMVFKCLKLIKFIFFKNQNLNIEEF